MNQPSCLSCKKSQDSQLISLVCDHVLCISCAETLKTIQGHSNIQNKFRIGCPSCKKGTVTYDIKNLLLKTTSDNLMFENIQDSQLNESSLVEDEEQPITHNQNLKEMSYSQRVNNLSRRQSRTPDVCFEWRENKNKMNYDSNRASVNGNREQDYSSICKQHSQNLIFFCEVQKKLLCMECMYKHTKQYKNHKVHSIKNSLGIITKENILFKDETKKKMLQLQEYIKINNHNKTILQDKFKLSLEMVSQEFAAIETMLKSREAAIKDSLNNQFAIREKELNTEIGDLTHLQNCLKQYMTFQLQGTSSQVYFFHAYSLLRQAMSKLNLKAYPISPSNVNFLDRIDPVQIKVAIDRLFQLPREKRSESRVDSAHPKHPSMINQQIKNAKKKLEKLQRLGKGDKINQYLNNYISGYSKQKQFHRERRSIHGQNQRGAYSKVMTPTRISTKLKYKK